MGSFDKMAFDGSSDSLQDGLREAEASTTVGVEPDAQESTQDSGYDTLADSGTGTDANVDSGDIPEKPVVLAQDPSQGGSGTVTADGSADTSLGSGDIPEKPVVLAQDISLGCSVKGADTSVETSGQMELSAPQLMVTSGDIPEKPVVL